MTYKRELETFTETSYARALRSWSVCQVVQSRDDRGGRGFTDVTGVFSSARELVCWVRSAEWSVSPRLSLVPLTIPSLLSSPSRRTKNPQIRDEWGNQIWICPGCDKPDDGSPMIGCDDCDDWYHW